MNKANQVYDVVIVGAGWSGLLSCKYCLAESLKTLVLEDRDRIGGVWAYTDDPRYGGVMKTTNTTSSRCITEISDFPMPDDYPDFPSYSQIHAYLESYCARFSLTEHIHLNRRVTRIAKAGDLWRITTSDGGELSARNVIVSSGVHQYPKDVSKDHRFNGYIGSLMHSAAVKEITTEFAGKKIVVWGGGESASDVAHEASKVASRVYLCIPNGQWMVPKIVDRWRPFPSSQRKVVDHTSSRLRLLLSPTHLYSPFISQYLEFAFGFNGHGQEAWRTAAPYNRSFFNKSADVLLSVKSGRVIPRRDIASCRGTTVYFNDATSDDIDYIITCSGYRMSFPFLEGSDIPSMNQRKLFKGIFYNKDPSLAYVGFMRPIFGSIPGISELQGRYAAKVIAGKCVLPDHAKRDAIIEKDAKFWNHHFRFTSQRLTGLVDHFIYNNQLARMIGCRPNYLKLFLTSPRRWWKAITAPWNGCQFWLNDTRHHDRIFETFRKYDDNHISQIYVFLALAPILPLIGLMTHIRVVLRERFALGVSRPGRGT